MNRTGFVAGALALALAGGGAGIDAGDRITGIDGGSTTTPEQLRAAIAAHEPGGEATVRWVDADGSRHSDTVTLVEGPVA